MYRPHCMHAAFLVSLLCRCEHLYQAPTQTAGGNAGAHLAGFAGLICRISAIFFVLSCIVVHAFGN